MREAINAANMVNGADVIIFSVSGTITLGSNLPGINSEVTIDGAGQAITVSGDYGYRPMAVRNNAMLNLNAMTITNGSGDNGGGIENYGTLNVSNSTFSGNSSRPSYPSGSILNINGTVTLQNSIIANSLDGSDCINAGSGSTLNADSDNMDSDGSCDNATTQTAVQLNLGALADNGGDTQTIALLPGSSAIDAGDESSCPATDQRGVTHPQGLRCDIGAYELEISNFLPVVMADAYSTDEGTQLDVAAPGVLENDSDADGDVLTAVLVDNTNNGNLTLN